MSYFSGLALGTAAVAMIAALTSGADTRQASTIDSDGCLPAASTVPRVADRIERALEACEQGAGAPTGAAQQGATERMATCVSAARRDGFRPADRLERDITRCIRDGD